MGETPAPTSSRYRPRGSLYECVDCTVGTAVIPRVIPGRGITSIEPARDPVVVVDTLTHDRWHAEQYAHLDSMQGTMFG